MGRVVFQKLKKWRSGLDAQQRGEAFRIHKRITDFVSGGLQLFWQRQTMFIGATLLTGYYFSFRIAFLCYGLLLVSEAVDYIIAHRIMRWDGRDPQKARHFLWLLTFSTILSAGAVSLFAILVARQEGQSYHFTPLLFIFAAAIFAGMYNHQLVRILAIRLVIYGLTLIYIPGRDVWALNPPMSSLLWLQFATTLFVLYFIVDSSLVFLRLYRKNLNALEALRAEHEKTKRAYEAKSQFLAVVSHELRTPLTSIKGGLDISNSGVLGAVPDNMKPILEAAQKNSHRLADLIDDLLDLQKIESGEMSFEKARIDLVLLAQEAVRSCESYGDLAGVTFALESDVASLPVMGDYDRLMQVMANLLSNAAKFSHKGGKVGVRVERVGDKARILVEDHGIGIPDGAKSKVFGRFTQVDSSDQRKIGGTGLGMSISQKIMEQHDGMIDYTSKVDVGTTFVIELEALAPATATKQVPGTPRELRIRSA